MCHRNLFPMFKRISYQFFPHLFAGFLLFLSIFVYTNALRAIDNSLSSDDNTRLKQVSVEGLKSDDLTSVFFSAVNLFKELSAQEKSAVCNRLAKLHTESKLNVSFHFVHSGIKIDSVLFILIFKYNILLPFFWRISNGITIWLAQANCLIAKMLCPCQFRLQSKHPYRKTQQRHRNCISISLQTNLLEIHWMKQRKHESQQTYKTFWRPTIRWASKWFL